MMEHKRLRLEKDYFLRDIENIAHFVNGARRSCFDVEKNPDKEKDKLGFMAVQLEYRRKRIDFYLSLCDLYVVGFDPNPETPFAGTRYHLSIMRPAIKQGSSVPLGKSTEILDLRPEQQELRSKTEIFDFVLSRGESYNALGYHGAYAENEMNFGKLDADFDLLKMAVNGFGGKPEDSFYRALGTMAMVISESIRFVSISKYFNDLLKGEAFTVRDIKWILDVVQNWEVGTKNNDIDVRVPLILTDEVVRLRCNYYEYVAELMKKEEERRENALVNAKEGLKSDDLTMMEDFFKEEWGELTFVE
ncbi:hypothetical protein ACG1BZ_03740 [Microbulbifer sp. CNSA002]|uniref:hypothetical protein n=1 Tax=unclassified Microbulbifer TaxID=2619833 RepID=UPI0039B6167D